MNSETVKIAEGERIDVIKESVGYSINGPAIVVVLKEESATEVTELNDYKFVNGVAIKETE